MLSFSGCRNPDLEFPCTSGDECIPIYDTCNGIPQCQDGSDEKDCPGIQNYLMDKNYGLILIKV